jgi:hypothetical protein
MLYHSRLFVLAVVAGLTLSVSPASAQDDNCGKGTKVFPGAIGSAVFGRLSTRVERERQRERERAWRKRSSNGLVGAIDNKLEICEQQLLVWATLAAAHDNSRPGRVWAWRSETRPTVNGVAEASPMGRESDGRRCRTITRYYSIAGKEMRDALRLCWKSSVSAWVVADVGAVPPQ